jgi:hypothetical protein
MKGSHLKEKKSDTRAKNWSFLVYLDSAPDNWKSIIDSWHLPVAVSPVHNKDVYDVESEDHKVGELKKPHYHCVVSFGNKTSFSRVCEILEPLNSPIPVVCKNVSSMVRYFIHRDNPTKAQYSKDSILSFGGFDIESPFSLKLSDYSRILREIYDIMRNSEIDEYSELFDCVMSINPEYVVVLARYAIPIDKYLTSRRFSSKNKA